MDFASTDIIPAESLSPKWQKRRSISHILPSQQSEQNGLSPQRETEAVAGTERPKIREHRAHSASEPIRLEHKSRWAAAIIVQEPVQQSISALTEAAERYEKQATQHQWDDLLKARADVAELLNLANSNIQGQEKQKKQTGLDKFCNVALEYSKLLDVVMNQAPEYAALAWGVMKVLLVANINHAKLKENVEATLMSIGEKLGLVSHFVSYNPTEMVAISVGLLYADFSNFLEKALKYYAKSKLMTVLTAFTFPWETKLSVIVGRIERHFQRVKDLCSASNLSLAVQNHYLLHEIWSGQREMKDALLNANNEGQLCQKLNEEVGIKFSGLFQSFETSWLGRFEQLVQKQASTAKKNSFTTERTLDPKDCLSAEIGTENALLAFRDRVHPNLARFEEWESSQRLRRKNMTLTDLQHCSKLLDHSEIQAWIQRKESTMIWINGYQNTKKVDWMSIFASDVVEHASRLKDVTVLTHFGIGSYSNKEASSAYTVLFAIIFQMLLKHRKQFLDNTAPSICLKRFKAAKEDLGMLCEIFEEVAKISNPSSMWLVLDRADVLSKQSTTKEKETLQLLAFLDKMVDCGPIRTKVLVTSRVGRSNLLSNIAREAEVISPCHAVINVPRNLSGQGAMARSRRPRKPHRLPPCVDLVAQNSPSNESCSKDPVRFTSDESSGSERYQECGTEPSKTGVSTRSKSTPDTLPSSYDTESAVSEHADVLDSTDDDEEYAHTADGGPVKSFAATRGVARWRRVSSEESSENDLPLPEFGKRPVARTITWETEPTDSEDARHPKASASHSSIRPFGNTPFLRKPRARSPLALRRQDQTPNSRDVRPSAQSQNQSRAATAASLETDDNSSDLG